MLVVAVDRTVRIRWQQASLARRLIRQVSGGGWGCRRLRRLGSGGGWGAGG